MNSRDYEYIHNRLSSPCNEAIAAHGRLIQTRQNDLAEELMEAMQKFTDETRRIRNELNRRGI